MELKGKGLFVYSDPGAAKAILSKALEFGKNSKDYRIISNRVYSFTDSFGLVVETQIESPASVFDSYKPDFLFSGTSYTSDFELLFAEEAAKRKIPSYAYIDHYVLFKQRFQLRNANFFPDWILVIDERARNLAVSEGLPKDKIQIIGNPYYQFLEDYKPKINKNQFLNSIGILDVKKALVVFAPEPLSNIDGKLKYGFDEMDACLEVKNILDQNNFSCNFIFKPHPNQDMKKLEGRLSDKFIFLDSDFDANLLIYHSDIVIGFFSNFLIEASIMRKKILRFHLSFVKNDPLRQLQIGTIVDREALVRELSCLT